MECDFSDPKSVVSLFIAAMHDWELESHRLRRSVRNSDDPSSYQPSVLESMIAIFGRFCTPKPRTYGRHGSFQNPPEYDPRSEAIEKCEINGSSASVFTYRDSVVGGGFYRYSLRRRNDRWLIDTLKSCGERRFCSTRPNKRTPGWHLFSWTNGPRRLKKCLMVSHQAWNVKPSQQIDLVDPFAIRRGYPGSRTKVSFR